jgi:hypothetical protein
MPINGSIKLAMIRAERQPDLNQFNPRSVRINSQAASVSPKPVRQ